MYAATRHVSRSLYAIALRKKVGRIDKAKYLLLSCWNLIRVVALETFIIIIDKWNKKSYEDRELYSDGEKVTTGDIWLFGTLAFVLITMVLVTIIGGVFQ